MENDLISCKGVMRLNSMDNIVPLFVGKFPEYEQKLADHIEFNEEILPHVFFGDEVNVVLIKFLKENKNHDKISSYFLFFEEEMYNNGDLAVRQILSTTILARLGDDCELLKDSYKFMGFNTRRLSKEIERFLQRKCT